MAGTGVPWGVPTILLIDDDPEIRKTFAIALRQRGYHLVEADSGFAGLEAAQKYLPDLILTDIQMPGGDGQTLLYHLRKNPELYGKQVVLMTGRPDLVPARTAMEAGADDFLLKPVSIENLMACVEARLARAEIHWRVEGRSLERLRASLLSTLPHELFNPLAGIMGLSEYLHANATIISLDEMQKLHNDIYCSGLRLQRTLTNYFRILGLENEVSRLDDRTLLPESGVHAAIQAGVDAVLSRPGPPREITLELSSFHVYSHDDDLRTIVEELVDNARKFSGIGTEIKVNLTKEGVLSVINQGRGMTEAQIRRIGAFQQFDRNKQAQEGLGLGLVLAQKLAERNGAKFSIESHPEKETTVSVAFKAGKHPVVAKDGPVAAIS